MRISAKELVPNHLTFYIFQHVAIFEPHHWPKGIGVNGMVKIEGEKMSKSKGNFIPLKKAIELYGADTTRATLLLAAEDLDDPDWREKNANEVRGMLDTLRKICGDAASANPQDRTEVDDWLLSILQRRKEAITSAMERLKTRTALSETLYGLYNDWRWYIRRSGGRVGVAAKKFVEEWVKLLAPFTPFTAEECWSMLGKDGFVSMEKWPMPQRELIDEYAELREELLRNIMDDVRSIMEVYGKGPSRIVIYVASERKRVLLRKLAEAGSLEPRGVVGTLIKWMISENVVDSRKAPTLAKLMIDTLTSLTSRYGLEAILRASEEELNIYRETAEFLEREFGAEVAIFPEDQEGIYDPLNKAPSALPLRPGIFIE
ncbi:MAG: class I tRNA ligase family protein, partial [Aigarchaeota archaeon]|nr:class I tRNA ligase family protein [Aigarchaeota archaeon]